MDYFNIDFLLVHGLVIASKHIKNSLEFTGTLSNMVHGLCTSVTPPSEAMTSYVNAPVSNYFILFETKQIIDIAAKLKTC